MPSRLVNIKVKTNSKQSSVQEDKNGNIRVSVRARPIKGAANDEVLKILAYYFKTPKSNISIKSGLKSKNKIILIGSADD